MADGGWRAAGQPWPLTEPGRRMVLTGDKTHDWPSPPPPWAARAASRVRAGATGGGCGHGPQALRSARTPALTGGARPLGFRGTSRWEALQRQGPEELGD